jgi:hypothetical protein
VGAAQRRGVDADFCQRDQPGLECARARGENLELELLPTANLDVRMLGYLNHANMGSYTQAIDAFLAEQTPTPEIDAHPRQG